MARMQLAGPWLERVLHTCHSWELAVINPGVVFGPVACPKLAQSLSISLPIVKNLNGDRCVRKTVQLVLCIRAHLNPAAPAAHSMCLPVGAGIRTRATSTSATWTSMTWRQQRAACWPRRAQPAGALAVLCMHNNARGTVLVLMLLFCATGICWYRARSA